MEPESPGPTQRRVKMDGWLKKQGGLMRQWHRRWFILNDNCLFYYNNEDDRNPTGTIFLTNQWISAPPPNPTDPDKFLFEISEPSGGTSTKGDNSDCLVLCAASNEERQKWVRALRRTLFADKGGAIFGQALEETMKYEHRLDREIPFIIEQCVEFLYLNGLDTEGLFRMPGRASMVRELTEKFDCGVRVDLQKIDADVHTVASLLKQYLRELPESIIPCCFYQRFMGAALTSQAAKNEEEKLQQVDILSGFMPELPDDNYRILKYLCRFLKIVGQHSQQNKMDYRNLGLILGYNLIRHMDSNPHIYAATTDLSQELVCMMLEHFDEVFCHDPAQRRVHNVPVDDLLRVSTIAPGKTLLQPMAGVSRQNAQAPGPGGDADAVKSENLRLLAELDLPGHKQEDEVQRRDRPNPARRSATLPSQSKQTAPGRSAPKPPASANAGGRDGGMNKSPPLVRPTPVPPARRVRPNRRKQIQSEDLSPLYPASPTSTASSSGSVSSFVFPEEEKEDSSSDLLSSSASAPEKVAAKSNSNEMPGVVLRQASRQASGGTSEPVENGSDHAGVDNSGKVLPSKMHMDLQMEAMKDELQRTKNKYEMLLKAVKAELVTTKVEHAKEKQDQARLHQAKMQELQAQLAAEKKSRAEAVDRIMLLQSQLHRYQLQYGELKGD